MSPTRTSEVRWFRRGVLPEALQSWFASLGSDVTPERRTDRYLSPASDALGVKLRQGQVEVKQREGFAGRLAMGSAEADVETWAKWSFLLADRAEMPDEGWIDVAKVRWQRHVEAGDGVCAVEISEVEVGGDVWNSVCLEAAGPTDEARRAALDAGAEWLATGDAPELSAAAAMGYPAWLRALGAGE